MKPPLPLYNQIGPSYNSTRTADLFISEKLFEYLEGEKDGLYLDIGCGTGNYTIALANKGLNLIGVEPSEVMLSEARLESSSISWLQGASGNIPLDTCCIHGAIATLTIHHWENLYSGFRELYRVLKPGGKLIIFTSTPEQMDGYWLNHYFPQMLIASKAKMPSLEMIEQVASETGFCITNTETYFIQPDLQDCFLYSGKHSPQMYFVTSVRKGISSFASLSHTEEVKKGLQMLKEDLDTQKFEDIKKRFTNDLGDYLFLCLRKT